MDGISGLIDPKNVELFDALRQLAHLDNPSDIEPPQVVVVGGQSSGKSSVLEAITRFQFPVHGGLCTRFPIKLTIRRSSSEETILSIIPGPSRRDDEKELLLQFRRSLAKPEEFSSLLNDVADTLGVRRPYDATRTPYQPYGFQTPPSLRHFTDDTVVIERCGPDLPLVDLVDLPGVFHNPDENQSEQDKQMVRSMVGRYISSSKNLVLLVVNAGHPIHVDAGLEIFRQMRKHDADLAKRVIGVVTNPDNSIEHDDFLKLFEGRSAFAALVYKWLVVKNQSKKQREQGDLNQRDREEKEFFETNESWKEVSAANRGIEALKDTLRELFWSHTRNELPDLVSSLRKKISVVKAQLEATGKSRVGALACRQFLSGIAEYFEYVTREAASGSYTDKKCEKEHMLDDPECAGCKKFFLQLDDESVEGQEKRLRATIRILNESFATAMQQSGKTNEIVFGGAAQTSTLNGSAVNGSGISHDSGRPSRNGNNQKPTEFFSRIRRKHYQHKRPEPVSLEDHETWLITKIDGWRGGEVQSEANGAVFARLFELESARWGPIAMGHLRAVWEATRTFVDFALAAACADADVRSALQQDLVEPRLEEMEKRSMRVLNDLLSSRSSGHAGFYDGFINLEQERWHARDLAVRLRRFAGIDGSSTDDSADAKAAYAKAAKDIFDRSVNTATNHSEKIDYGVFRDELLRQIEAAISHKGSEVPNGSSPSTRDTVALGSRPDELKAIPAARVIEYVETRYETIMVSFVGYVNSLVIESEILKKLPFSVLTQRLIMEASDEDVQRLARENDAIADQRVRAKADLAILQQVLKTVRSHM